MRSYIFAVIPLFLLSAAAGAGPGPRPPADHQWTLVQGDAPWGGRAGLQVVRLGGDFLLMGGRTPRPPVVPPIPGDSDIWGDVWRSTDEGRTWTRILETDDQAHWPARAYFQAATMRGHVYVLGGQNFQVIPNPACPDPTAGCPPFVSFSDFFDDVWRSRDGVAWERLTDAPGWEGRAGLSAIEFKGHLYVLGGSRNDDDSIIGGPPQRIYYNDVWRSRDGVTWDRVAEHAPWSARAGAAVTVKDGHLYLLGGEAGFLCAPQPCTLPYFNDVWRTRDGVEWELVTESAGFSPRPGHQCVTLQDEIVCFGGFGLPFNPLDMWTSRDGARWERLPDSPWNALTNDEGKYDFDALAVEGVPGRRGPAIFTFGGDRETFDFTDPENYLRVDSEVWRYAPEHKGRGTREALALEADVPGGLEAGNALRSNEGSGLGLSVDGSSGIGGPLVIRYALSIPGPADLAIYDVSGRRIRTLVAGSAEAGARNATWNRDDTAGRRVQAGVYFARLVTEEGRRTARVIVLP